MTGDCPKCGNGKIVTLWPAAQETRKGAYTNRRLKLVCFEALHEFEVSLPTDPEQTKRLLNRAFPNHQQSTSLNE